MPTTNANAALDFVDRNAVGEAANKPAFIEADGAGRSISYAQLKAESDQMAGLCHRHGLKKEDRIACLVLDQIEYPVIFWGALKAGVVPVALNTLLSGSVYGVILRDCRARALFISHQLYAEVAPLLAHLPWLEKVFVIGGETPDGALDFASEMALSAPAPTEVVAGDETAFWLYSSGSTGAPKGVLHVHSSLRATADTFGAGVLGIRPDDVVFSAAKIFFAYGLGNAMTFPMSVGATTVLYSQRPTPEAVLDVITRFSPTIFCGVPTLYAALLAYLDGPGEMPARRMRSCISAGEALPAEIGTRWAKLWGVDILDGVGSTEMLHIFLSNAPGDVEYGTSGVAVPGYDLRLVGEAGDEVAPGEVGELLVRGASAANGYWNQLAKTRDTFEGHWTRTGDKYERRADGRYIYCGRTDDMFKVSGIWVSPFEVEQALITAPEVLEAAVVAATDDEDLVKPKAFVVLKPGQSGDGLAESLKEHVKEQIGKWKYPRWVEVVDDLPKTATGKIQRFKLRERGR